MKNASRSNRKLEAITNRTIVVGIDIAKSRQWARFVDYRGLERKNSHANFSCNFLRKIEPPSDESFSCAP